MGTDSSDTSPLRKAASAAALAADLTAQLALRPGRLIIGICGAPGAGKSTLAAALARILGPDVVSVVPFDGFHLASALLEGTSLASRRGALETFDLGSYLVLLRRLRDNDEEVVYAPAFDRATDEPIASAIAIPRRIPLIITEGNYLLANEPHLHAARDLIDAVWYLDTPPDVRLPQLVARHVEFGKAENEAKAWASGTDQRNADAIETTRDLADLIISIEIEPGLDDSATDAHLRGSMMTTDRTPRGMHDSANLHDTSATSQFATAVFATGDQYTIRGMTDFGHAEASVAQVAAALRSLSVEGVDLVQRYPAAAPPSLGAGIVMVPWPNRIDRGVWKYRGEAMQLDITEPKHDNAIHGLLTQRPYEVRRHSDTSITLGATIYSPPGYPFILDTSVEYTITRHGLQVRHTLTNVGEDAAPVAVGTHGYFRLGDTETSDLILTSTARTVYVDDARYLPTGREEVGPRNDLRTGRRVGDVDLDNCFTDQDLIDGEYKTRLTAPDGRYVELWTDESFRYVVILTTDAFRATDGQPTVACAIEPQTAAGDSLNNEDGLKWLNPGESWQPTWGVRARL